VQANIGGAASFAELTTFIQVAADQVNAGTGVSGSCKIYNPSSTTVAKMWACFTGGQAASGANPAVTNMSSGLWGGGAGAVTGFQVLFTSGNITSGVIKVYGVP
jgi:hypothetical protein